MNIYWFFTEFIIISKIIIIEKLYKFIYYRFSKVEQIRMSRLKRSEQIEMIIVYPRSGACTIFNLKIETHQTLINHNVVERLQYELWNSLFHACLKIGKGPFRKVVSTEENKIIFTFTVIKMVLNMALKMTFILTFIQGHL